MREGGQSIATGRAPLSEGDALSKQTGLPGPCRSALSIAFPRDVGSISTVVTGIGCGAIAVQHFRAQEWVDSMTGLMALGGLIFGCGLPGWVIVRWVFNFIEKNRDAGIDEVAKEVKEVLFDQDVCQSGLGRVCLRGLDYDLMIRCGKITA